MREFMTKVSDYLNERRNDPERREDRLAIVIIGAVAVVVIVILLLVLWRHIVGERAQKQYEEATQVLETVTYEEEAAEYMSSSDEQENAGEEYLESIEYLSKQVEELLNAMTQVEQNLSETIEQYQDGDDELREQIGTLHTEVSTIVHNLKETQMKLYDLTDIVQIVDREKIPMIQEQILEIRGDMTQVETDITNLYGRIAELEKEDDKLWASIGEMEQTLQNVLNQNMTEVNNQFDTLLGQIESVENRIGKLVLQTLRYRYDAGENTLYLEPYEE
ncbi:MAG: hypothetical protein K2J99_06665 [Lachnospiraceae bacterium]|nr:hypothetical protein [Lachnospiraceae bacterium]